MASTAWEVMGSAATVAQLVGLDVGGIISTISIILRAAETAQQNKRECEHLARRVNMIAELLPQVQDPVAMRPLAGLGSTLREANQLLMACQRKSRTYNFFNARKHAESLKGVENRIDSYLLLFPIINHIGIARRLHGTVPRTTQADMDQPAVVTGKEFTAAEITAATDNFGLVLGEGDSGTVYMGRLRDGRHVAVKSVSNSEVRCAEEAFGMELALLSPVRHRHIIGLMGWCAEEESRLLVYDYEQLQHGALGDYLHPSSGSGSGSGSSSPVTTSWKTRVEVLLGVALAIEHLHCRAVPLIIHRNITSSNILLDATWTPRVSGFAASVWRAPPEMGPQMVNIVDGDSMEGYNDPEYRSSGHLKPASDVYNLGVVMLEVLTGKPPVVKDVSKRSMSLVSWALPRIRDRGLREVLDRRPASTPTARQLQALELVANTAARCVWLHSDNRPEMSEVVANLRGALDLIFVT